MYQWARRHPLTMASLQNLGKIPSFSIAIPFKARPTRSRPWPSPTSAMCRSRTCYSSAPPGRLPLVQVMGKKTKDYGFLRKNESYGWLTFKEIDGFIMFISYIYTYFFFFGYDWLVAWNTYLSLTSITGEWPSTLTGGTGSYIEVKSCVFSVEAHRAMEPGTIAFNKVNFGRSHGIYHGFMGRNMGISNMNEKI